MGPTATPCESVEELVRELRSAPPLCIVGSGVSKDPPASLPLADHVVKQVLPVICPDDASGDETDWITGASEKDIPGLPAERFFEVLLATLEYTLSPQDARQVTVSPWKGLDPRVIQSHLGSSYLPQPTLGHGLLVYLAWKAGAPIVTTNFDALLELAAQRLGLRAKAYWGDKPGEWPTEPASVDDLGIWKVHGTTSSPESIATTIATTSRAKPLLERRLLSALRGRSVFIVGYSGRDLDLCPVVARSARPVLWLGPESNFGISKFSPAGRARWFQGRMDEFAEVYIRTCVPRTDSISEKLWDLLERPEQRQEPPADAAARILGLFRTRAEREVAPHFSDERDRWFFWALALLRAYNFGAAAKYAERYLERPDGNRRRLCRARLVLSVAYDGLSLFEQMYAQAKRASDDAGASKWRALQAQAENLESRSVAMLYLPHVGFSDARYTWRHCVKSARAFGRRCRSWLLLRRLARQPKPEATPDEFEAYAARLEAASQIASLLHRIPCVSMVSILWFRLISSLAHRCGLADIAAAAEHHRLRNRGSAADLQAEVARDFLGDRRMHKALLKIAIADERMRRGRPGDAIQPLKEAVSLASEIGDRLTKLKAYVRLRRCGVPVDQEAAARCLDEIEGESYADRKEEILSFLSGGPPS